MWRHKGKTWLCMKCAQMSEPSKQISPYSESKYQTSHLLIYPHWWHWKRPIDTCKNTGNHWMENSAIGSLILERWIIPAAGFMTLHKRSRNSARRVAVELIELLWYCHDKRISTLWNWMSFMLYLVQPNFQKMAQRKVMLFDSMCMTNTNKAPRRSQSNDKHLRSVLRIVIIKHTPDFDKLAKKGCSTTLFPL